MGPYEQTVQDIRQHRDARLLAAYAGCLSEPVVYCDVGALWGALNPLVRELNRSRQLRIVGFEPDEAECGRLATENPGNLYFPFCLGDEDGQRTFYRTRYGACSSFLRPNLEGLVPDDPHRAMFEVVQETAMTCARYDTLRRNRGAPSVSYLKVDTQGFEMHVLNGFGAELDAVLGIEIETRIKPAYYGDPMFHELYAYLSARGFILRDLRRAGPVGYDLFEFDAFFSRRRIGIDAPTLAKLELWDFVHDIPPGRTVQVSGNTAQFFLLS